MCRFWTRNISGKRRKKYLAYLLERKLNWANMQLVICVWTLILLLSDYVSVSNTLCPMRLPLKKINIFSDSDTIQQSNSHKQTYFLSNEQKTLINKKKNLKWSYTKQPLAWQFAVWRQTSKHVSAPVSQTPPFRRLEGEFQKS